MQSTEGRPGSSLTKREEEALELVALGLMNHEIARQLCLSRRTVETHVERVLHKLGATTRTHAVAEAGRARLLRRSRAGTIDRSHNLPVQVTSFIGRRAELSELEELLTNARLVTIVGAGGVGKTRVAVHAGAQLLRSFDDGWSALKGSSLPEHEILWTKIEKSIWGRSAAPTATQLLRIRAIPATFLVLPSQKGTRCTKTAASSELGTHAADPIGATGS